MLGNVFEWCLDTWGEYSSDDLVDPPAAAHAASSWVRRGGSWGSFARFVRAAYRFALAPGDRYSSLGFRLARGLAPGQGAELGTQRGVVARGAARGENQ
jgi:formylglycine-generating enzyme required for sulfatase activity